MNGKRNDTEGNKEGLQTALIRRQKEAITRNKTIDFFKGVCILFVIICHFDFTTDEYKLFGPFLLQMAVPSFMIMSGYTYVLSAKKWGFRTN